MPNRRWPFHGELFIYLFKCNESQFYACLLVYLSIYLPIYLSISLWLCIFLRFADWKISPWCSTCLSTSSDNIPFRHRERLRLWSRQENLPFLEVEAGMKLNILKGISRNTKLQAKTQPLKKTYHEFEFHYYQFIIINIKFAWCQKINATLKAKAIDIWPRDASRSKPGLENYITGPSYY